jgi:hypothetical protein
MAHLYGLVMVNRHRWINPCRAPLRIVIKLGRGAGILILYSVLFIGIALADTPTRHELPMHAIVRGRNIQPRVDQLKALGYSDLTPQEADEVDRLYRELLNDRGAPNQTPS